MHKRSLMKNNISLKLIFGFDEQKQFSVISLIVETKKQYIGNIIIKKSSNKITFVSGSIKLLLFQDL